MADEDKDALKTYLEEKRIDPIYIEKIDKAIAEGIDKKSFKYGSEDPLAQIAQATKNLDLGKEAEAGLITALSQHISQRKDISISKARLGFGDKEGKPFSLCSESELQETFEKAINDKINPPELKPIKLRQSRKEKIASGAKKAANTLIDISKSEVENRIKGTKIIAKATKKVVSKLIPKSVKQAAAKIGKDAFTKQEKRVNSAPAAETSKETTVQPRQKSSRNRESQAR